MNTSMIFILKVGVGKSRPQRVEGASGEDHGDVNYSEYQEQNLESGGGEDVDATGTVIPRRRFHMTWQDLKERTVHGLVLLWSFLLATSYVPAIICMMVCAVSMHLMFAALV